MPDTGAPYNLPYPALTDSPNVPADVQALAESVETELIRVDAALLVPPAVFVYAEADILTNLSGTFTDVTGFSFAAAAGIDYAIDCVMFIANPSANAADLKFGWAWTGTGSMTAGQSGIDVGVDSPNYSGSNTAHALVADASTPLEPSTGLGTPLGISVIARLGATYFCTTAGTVQLRFSQFVASGTATRVQHGSRMRVEPMN